MRRRVIIACVDIYFAHVSSRETSGLRERMRNPPYRADAQKTFPLKRLHYRKPLVKSPGGGPIKRK
jgi:hypothetical protein